MEEVAAEKICTNCGTQLDVNAKFCPGCGRRFEEGNENYRKDILKIVFSFFIIIGSYLAAFFKISTTSEDKTQQHPRY